MKDRRQIADLERQRAWSMGKRKDLMNEQIRKLEN
jgi:hypothetical protein